MKLILTKYRFIALCCVCLCAATASAQSTDSDSSDHADHAAHGSNHDQAGHTEQDSNALMQQAQIVLDTADQLEQSAVGQIQTANQTRKQIKLNRAVERKTEDPDVRESLKSSTDALAAQIQMWQKSSAELRETSNKLRQAANALFKLGFTDIWRDWITNSEPLAVASGSTETMAHNNQIRSAHPTMKELTPSTGDMPEKHEGMTMRVPDMSSQPSTDDVNATTFQLSRDRNFLAHIEVESDAQTGAKAVPVNEIHRWRLIVSDLDGKAIEDATIELVGHMPGHVHGLPTQPRITEQVASGVYRIEGVKFQMTGWWVIEFNITDGDIIDTVKFDLLL